MVIIALALHDHAFDAPSLTDAVSVLTKQVWGPTHCLPLRWKEEKLKVPVFRRIDGTALSKAEAMLYSKLNYDMRRQSLDSGYEKAWTPRFARRGAANAANGMLNLSPPCDSGNRTMLTKSYRRRAGSGP